MNKFRKNAFTLMETLVTLVILGIVAAILVPNLINRQVQNANRTKVKKAMAAYEKAINFIILENDIKSTEELKEFGEEENCKFSKAYFKTVQDGANDCIFKTADRVWWDITDLTNPILILKDSQLNKTTTELQTLAKDISDKTVFALVGRFDDLGTLRVNDNAYEHGLENNEINQKYMKKLWYFTTLNDSLLTGKFDKCNVNGQKTCTLNVNGTEVTYTKVTTTNDTTKAPNGCLYIRETGNCTRQNRITAPAGDYWMTGDLGRINVDDAKSEETCNASIFEYCETNGDYYEAAKIKCNKLGAHLATLPELKIASDNGLISGSYSYKYWAAEEVLSSNYASYMYSNTTIINRNEKATSENRVLCVGNE